MSNFRIALTLLALVCCLSVFSKKKYPVLKCEQTVIDLGTFSQDDPVQKCTFKFRNVGNDKLIINYVHTSCGCTVADYPKNPISPGASGTITVTYDGTGKMPGKFKKTIEVFSNTKEEVYRLVIQGVMSSMPKEVLKKSATTK